MAARDQGRGSPDGSEPLRIEAGPRERRLTTVAQAVLVLLILGLVGSGTRVVGMFWPERADPEVGLALWLFVAVVAVAGLTLAWLVIMLQDLVKMTIEVTDEALTVERWVAPFRVTWGEVREVGLARGRGQLTVRTARGTLTASERLLGRKPFARLAAALQAHAGPAVSEWSAWAATRRQLVLLAGPAVGLAFLLAVAQGIWRRRLPRLGPGGWRR